MINRLKFLGLQPELGFKEDLPAAPTSSPSHSNTGTLPIA